jgi:hemerythrin-like domain-containing protein
MTADPPGKAAARGGPAADPAAHGPFDILAHTHLRILEKLTILEDLARGLHRSGEFTLPVLATLADVLTFLDSVIPLHEADEERTLFPRLRKTPRFAGAEGTPMDWMENEHAEHQAALTDLKRHIMRRDAAESARSALELIERYREHIVKEDDILFPWARDLLTDAAVLTAMAGEMIERRRRLDLPGI